MADIVLRDRSGNPVEYPGIEKINLNTVDGNTQGFASFNDDELVPGNIAKDIVIGGVTGTMEVPESVEKNVTQDELNFANGAITLTPEEGQAFSGVNIPVPDNLVAGSIAEGVNIAGIIGTLKGGGSARVACGTTLGNHSSGKVVTHGLGIVPDFVVVFSTFSSNNYGLVFFGQSEAFAAVSGISYGQYGWKTYSSKVAASVYESTPMDKATSGVVYNTNEKTFTFGSSSIYALIAYSHFWIAVGGLT